jgi:hypothetical protein
MRDSLHVSMNILHTEVPNSCACTKWAANSFDNEISIASSSSEERIAAIEDWPASAVGKLHCQIVAAGSCCFGLLIVFRNGVIDSPRQGIGGCVSKCEIDTLNRLIRNAI